MPVFFVSPACIVPPAVSITGELLVHLRDSLRVAVGDTVWFCDNAGRRYRAHITALTKHAMTGRIIETLDRPPQSTPPLILAQALLKGEKMDWVIQKAAELGARTIVPIQSRHSIVQLKPERIEAQLARWQRIALEAAQQSEQWTLPTIAPPASLTALLAGCEPGMTTLLLAERQHGKSLRTVELPSDSTGSVLVLIGPEGGWSKEEIELAARAGCDIMTLGQHILRAETAAVAAVSILQSRLGNLG